jgi:hypothetical protein
MRHLAALLAVLAACDGGEGIPDARPPDANPPTGTFSLSWTLTDTTDGLPISCDDANATTVSVTAVEQVSGTGFVEIFNCTSMQGTSRPARVGTYSLGFSLRGPDGEVTAAPGVSGIEVNVGQDTPAGAHDFALDGTGGISFRINTARATNCGAIVSMGSGIDTMALTLTKGGACVPVDWTVGAGTYSATCPMPPTTACIENDVDIVATGLDAGRYQLQAVGNIAIDACWLGMRELRVPPGGMTAMTTVTLGYQDTVPACPPLP